MSFDVLAPHYRWMEFVLAGEKLQRCRTAFLEKAMGAKKVLILGEGNGRFLVECRRKLPEAKIICVDASARMLAEAKERLSRARGDCRRVDFVCANALEWIPPEDGFDLIVTHFFLDCFHKEQLELLITKLTGAVVPGANWLLADFQAASEGLERWRSRIILWMMYRFFRVVTRLPAGKLTPPDDLLGRTGFRLQERRVSEWGLLRSDWWQLARKN